MTSRQRYVHFANVMRLVNKKRVTTLNLRRKSKRITSKKKLIDPTYKRKIKNIASWREN